MTALNSLNNYILEYESGQHRTKFSGVGVKTSSRPSLTKDFLQNDNKAPQPAQEYFQNQRDYDQFIATSTNNATIEKLKYFITKLDSLKTLRAHRFRQLNNTFMQDFENDSEFGESIWLCGDGGKEITEEEYNALLFGEESDPEEMIDAARGRDSPQFAITLYFYEILKYLQ